MGEHTAHCEGCCTCRAAVICRGCKESLEARDLDENGYCDRCGLARAKEEVHARKYAELYSAYDDELKQALEICCDPHFIAMLYANAFAGSKPKHWLLLYHYTVRDLIREAEARGLPLDTWKTV